MDNTMIGDEAVSPRWHEGDNLAHILDDLRGEKTMIQVQAFAGYATEGQRACNMATKRANNWLKEHPEAKVLSLAASQNAYRQDEFPGQEYTVTLLVELPDEEETDEEDEDFSYEMDDHWEERKHIESHQPIDYDAPLSDFAF